MTALNHTRNSATLQHRTAAVCNQKFAVKLPQEVLLKTFSYLNRYLQ